MIKFIRAILAFAFAPFYANSAGMCASFKAEIMSGIHALGPGGSGVPPARTVNVADTVKAALFKATGSLSNAVTAYGTAPADTGNELAASGNYSAGGVTVTMGNAPSVSGTTGIFTPSASLVWNNLTSSAAFDTCLFYNSSQASRAISVHTFSSQNITNGTFTLTMPTNDATHALLQIG